MTLLEECLEKLGPDTMVVADDKKKNEIIKKMIENFPPTFYGRINWDNISNKHSILSPPKIYPTLKNAGKITANPIYIIWSDSSMPVVQSKLEKILECFDDVEAVSPNTWLYCPSEGWVIELYHDGDITLGFE